jgi:hypothetical protein
MASLNKTMLAAGFVFGPVGLGFVTPSEITIRIGHFPFRNSIILPSDYTNLSHDVAQGTT